MTTAQANGINIEFETFGQSEQPTVLLIMGLGAQMTNWDPKLCQAIADLGFYVIRYDNRDVGLSTWFDEAGACYSIGDMADDAAGLLDYLDIETAHIVGASMGGMIAQAFAIKYPKRTRTLTSIMSTTGDQTVGQPRPEAIVVLMVSPPTSRDEAIEQSVALWRTIGSPGFAFDEQMVRERAGASYDRAFHPSGTGRQLVAVMTQPDRTTELGQLLMPVLVIHGEEDPLVDVSGGRATAAAIAGSQLKLIPGMGHNLPPELFDEFASDLAKHFSTI
jgi:pimeloyl-ACP methyl ester carboxylesterase